MTTDVNFYAKEGCMYTEEVKKPHIVIVDDEPSNIRMLSSALRDDYDISVATDGNKAIETITQSAETIDLILLDIMMPGLSGYNVCTTLKRASETKHIPIIFITGKTTAESEEKGFNLGAVDYITKPFSMAVVKARVKTHVTLKTYYDLMRKLITEQSVKVKKYEKEYQRLFSSASNAPKN